MSSVELQNPPTTDGLRRAEILDTAARLFGTSGFRTSLKEIADACGILPGSLYHHFESKEAIVIELVKRYQAELETISEQALNELNSGAAKPILNRIIALAEAITDCASRHRAALLQTIYDPPAGASGELAELANRTPMDIYNAMQDILRVGCNAGYIRADINLARLAEYICQTMLHGGIGVYHSPAATYTVPALQCKMVLEGLALDAPDNARLERSAAFGAAEKVMAGWNDEEKDARAQQLISVARTEFGRRGYEATTIRDVALAAGMSTGMVYRLAGSKDKLLTSIMGSYVERLTAGWDAVVASSSTPVEKFDALVWINTNVLNRFSDEFKIQLGWIRQSPPNTSKLGKDLSFARQLRQLEALLKEGERDNYFRVVGGSVKTRTASLFVPMWVSENIVRAAGARSTLDLARDTLIRGAARQRQQ